MVRFLLIFALIAVAEMATFFWVESWIGLGWALGLALTTALIGSYLVKRAGVTVLARLQSRLRAGEVPGRELSDGATVLVAGAFLISPGFITDTLGFLLLAPPVQTLVYRVVSARFTSRFGIRVSQPGKTSPTYDVIDVDPLD